MAERIRRVVLGLGSNLGDRRGHVRSAAASLQSVPGVFACSLSNLYETDPVGGPTQGDYVNAAVILHTSLDAWIVLKHAQELEVLHNRVRAERNGPRTLDVDVLWIEGETVDDPLLTVPHPKLLERAFALVPLLDVAPDACHPATGCALADSLAALSLQGIRVMARTEGARPSREIDFPVWFL